MMTFKGLAAVSALIMGAATAVAAQETTTTEAASEAAGETAQAVSLCEKKDGNKVIAIALCPTGLSHAELIDEGTAICYGRVPCGVWFWTDEANMPETAPQNHDGLTKEQITSALAVWVAEKGSLIEIGSLKNSE